MLERLYSTSPPVLGGPELLGRRDDRQFGLLPRLVALAALFAAEYAATVIWPFGHVGYRLKASVVTFAAIFFTFSRLRSNKVLQSISTEVSTAPLSRGFLAAHFCAMAAYETISWVYGQHVLNVLRDLAAPMRWITSGAGIALAACAFMPLALWLRLLRDTGLLWLYSLLASIATFVSVDYLQPLWSWNLFGRLTFVLVKTFLSPFVSTVITDTSTRVLGTPSFSVEIAEGCSGFEGVGLMLAFAAVWLWLFRKECRFPQAFLLIPLGATTSFLLNAVRITVLILIGSAGAPAIAIGGFHTAAGWCLFCAAALGFSVYASRARWLMKGELEVHQSVSGSWENPTAVYLLPFCGILAAGMAVTLAEADFDWLYPARFFAAAGALWFLRRRYGTLDWKFGWCGPAIGVLAFAMWLGIDSLMGATNNDAMPLALANSPESARVGWIFVRVLSAIVTVPAAEELAFRGFLVRRLISTDFESVPLNKFTWFSVAISSLLFGALHGNLWLAGLLAGLLYAWAMIRRGKFGDAVVAHATTNALLAAYVLLFHHWHFW